MRRFGAMNTRKPTIQDSEAIVAEMGVVWCVSCYAATRRFTWGPCSAAA